DWLLIVNRRHPERVLRVFADHYNTHRPHHSLQLTPPTAHVSKLRLISPPSAGVERRDRLGGLIHEYRHAARTGFAHPTGLRELPRQPGREPSGREPMRSSDVAARPELV